MASTTLILCTSCDRHVRADDPACPFCRAALAPAGAEPPATAPLLPRASRAALLALGVAVVASGCIIGAPAYGAPPPDTGSSDAAGD